MCIFVSAGHPVVERLPGILPLPPAQAPSAWDTVGQRHMSYYDINMSYRPWYWQRVGSGGEAMFEMDRARWQSVENSGNRQIM